MSPTIILIAVISFATWTGGVYYKGHSTGYAKAISENSEALAKRDDTISKLKADHVSLIQTFQSQINQTRNQADAKLRKLLIENTELQKVWNLVLPAGVVDYAWGVQSESDRRSVPHR